MTSKVSGSVYTTEQSHRMLRFVESLRHNDGNFGYAACVVGRLMSTYGAPFCYNNIHYKLD